MATIDVLFPIFDPTPDYLSSFKRSAESLRSSRFRLCVADGGVRSCRKQLDRILKDYEYTFLKGSGVYNKARCCNFGFRQLVKSEVFIQSDIDIVWPRDLYSRISELYDEKRDFVSKVKIYYLKNRDPKLPIYIEQFQSTGVVTGISPRYNLGLGGGFVCPGRIFELVNGFDEHFEEWGDEDKDLLDKFSWSKVPVVESGIEVLHLGRKIDDETRMQRNASLARNRSYYVEKWRKISREAKEKQMANDNGGGSIVNYPGGSMEMSERKELGKVSEQERDEIRTLYDRKNGLSELAKSLATMNREVLENNYLYDKLTADMGRVASEFQAMWDRMSKKYAWENLPGHRWEIDFDTCTVFIRKQ